MMAGLWTPPIDREPIDLHTAAARSLADLDTDRSTDDDSGWSTARRVSIRRTVTMVNPHYVSESDPEQSPSKVLASTDRSFFYLPEDPEKYRWTGGRVEERDLREVAALPPPPCQGRFQTFASLAEIDNRCGRGSLWIFG